MNKIFYLLRHGETQWNKEWRLQGQRDIELSERGIEQAYKAAERLKDLKVDYAFSSDLKRAVKTGEIVTRSWELELKKEPLLREVNFGKWEGLRYDDFTPGEQEEFQSWLDDPDWEAPQGGSQRELQERIKKFLSQSLEGEEDKKIFVATHGGPIKTIISEALGMDLKNSSRLAASPASLSIVHYYGNKGYLVLFNDTCHLAHV